MISEDGQRFGFHKRELTLLTSVMAGEDRETFAAVWFHPGKGQAWATDGHRAVMAERDEKPPNAPAGSSPVALPAATAHHAAKTAGAKDVIVIDVSGESVAIEVREPISAVAIEAFEAIEARTRVKHAVSCSRHRAEIGSIEGFFPPYHTRGSKGAIVALNPALLRPVAHLGKISDPVGRVWLNIGKPSEPATFATRAKHGVTWRMLVMPMKMAIEDHPDFGRAPAKPARAGRGRSSKSKGVEPREPAAKSGKPGAGGTPLRAVS